LEQRAFFEVSVACGFLAEKTLLLGDNLLSFDLFNQNLLAHRLQFTGIPVLADWLYRLGLFFE
jgi:hypothetical protein